MRAARSLLSRRRHGHCLSALTVARRIPRQSLDCRNRLEAAATPCAGGGVTTYRSRRTLKVYVPIGTETCTSEAWLYRSFEAPPVGFEPTTCGLEDGWKPVPNAPAASR